MVIYIDNINIRRRIKGEIESILVRVYNTQKDYADAISLLEDVRILSYQIFPNYADIFDPHIKNYAESIFKIQDIVNAYEPDDKQKNTSISFNFTYPNTGEVIPHIKYNHPSSQVGYESSDDFIVIRYAIALLMLEECLSKDGFMHSGETFQLLNEIGQGADLPVKSTYKNLEQIKSSGGKDFPQLYTHIMRFKSYLRGIYYHCFEKYIQGYLNEFHRGKATAYNFTRSKYLNLIF